ncbi:MAG: PAS domain-containing protein [Bryobacteraceae bacterium]|nr:PAS domain-containing protein [Bryobacteraceae bacterium]
MFSLRSITTRFTRICVTIALPVLAVPAGELLRPQLEPTFEPVLIAAVAVVCWTCGPLYATAAIFFCAVLFLYFFLPPYYSFQISGLNAALKYCFFLGTNGLVVGLIANLYNAQKALIRSERRYRNLSELIPFGGWISDGKGSMEHVSDSFLSTFGVTLKECLGSGWMKLIVPEQQKLVKSEWQECVAHGYFWDFEYRMMGRDGEIRVVLSRGVPVSDPAGRTVSWIGMHLDVTERERSIDEQVRQARDLARFNAELDQFAYVSAHDLQEPLRIISSYLQLLKRRYGGKLGSDADEFISYAVEGANRLRALLQDLLLLQNVGKSARERRKHSLSDLVHRALDNLGQSAADAAISYTGLPEVSCDDHEFIQLFEHMISNAIKYARDGVPPEILVTADRTPDGVTICVADNGIGVAPEYRYRIFEIFQRLHSRGQYPGTGIGLAICRKIVEVHGGRIWVDSATGEGSSFCFSLPEAN